MLQCERQGEYNLREAKDWLEILRTEGNGLRASAGPAKLIAGRLALDFANLMPVAHDLSWTEFVDFLVDSKVVGEERGMRLESLEGSEPGAVDAVLLKILRLRECVRAVF